MLYTQEMPTIEKIAKLAADIRSYPVTAKQVLLLASGLGYSLETINFIKQFPGDAVFESRVDFLTRCEDLRILLNEELRLKDFPQEDYFAQED